MYRSAVNPMPHVSTSDDITTINYTLEWPYLENPSNTTFAGPTQIDRCRCPSSTLPQQKDKESGHIYTRYECVGPEVRFHPPEEKLWVLQAPHGPINMLRPATRAETERREAIHNEAEPTVYAGKNFLFLTGPCPRGRYQAYATLQFLKSLSSEARKNFDCLSLLIQPYEEDCSNDFSQKSYAELADYIVHHMSGFRTLCLNIWDDEMRLRRAASEYSLLLHKEDAKIVVGCSWWRGEVKEYNSVKTFLEAMTTTVARDTKGRRLDLRELKDSIVWKEVTEQEEDEAHEADFEDQAESGGEEYEGRGSIGGRCTHASSSSCDTSGEDKEHNKDSDHEVDSGERQGLEKMSDGQGEDLRKGLCSNYQGKSEVIPTQEDYLSDDEWTDATLSPVSHTGDEEGSWQVL